MIILKMIKILKRRKVKVDNYLEDCVLPSDENPFMNVLLTDKRTRKPACKTVKNKKIKKLVNDKFSQGLFKDINSVYDRENSQREFLYYSKYNYT